jgi:predicted metal-dependent TIM-barrel fold hydrolase
MVSRTTDDYQAMITAGCAAVCEPSFWAGFDRTSVQGFYDYFLQLTQYEPNRAKKFQLPHYSWLCINAKEAEDIKLAEEVISIIPEFIEADNVLGIGEIGLNRNTKNELTVFEMQVDFACKHNQMILIHTPHLEDKKKGDKTHSGCFGESFTGRSVKSHHRSRGGAHNSNGEGSWVLGWGYTLPRFEMQQSKSR